MSPAGSQFCRTEWAFFLAYQMTDDNQPLKCMDLFKVASLSSNSSSDPIFIASSVTQMAIILFKIALIFCSQVERV